MVKFGNISERWLIVGISLLMVLALAMVARILSNTNERGERIGMMMLDHTLESQEERVRLISRTFAWDLMEEADRIHHLDTLQDSVLLERWIPILRSRHAILDISLANEHGDERVLHHADSMWRFIKSERNENGVVSMASQWPINRNQISTADSFPPQIDPRRSIWFSRALENRKDEPVWSESETREETKVLHLSVMIRGKRQGQEFRVLRFNVDADAMLSNLTQWTSDVSTILLDSKWRPLTHLDTSEIGQAWRMILRERQVDHSTNIFRSSADQIHRVGQIVPMEFNGTRFYTGVLIGFEGIERWNSEGRIGLWAVLGLLVLLGLMLALIFVQSRSTERHAQRQQRRSNLQARHLAQAIGEREVLDREVHHRVKKNLQVVSSLLNLQAQRVPEEKARAEFMRGKRRIDSMALVHHKLYRQQDLSSVDLGVFLDDLAKAVAAMFDPDSRSVSHSVDSSGIRCDADTSIQLGMILCELLANAHQHAFPYATGGHISIAVRDVGDGSNILQVKDNGKGFDPSKVLETHLGLEVVEALADQLDGSLHITSDGGTVVEVIFRCDRHTA